MKKRILCYGDSNTYGYMPGGGRYPDDVRWTCVLQKLLGDEYTVIEEGLGGRTTVYDDPVEGGYKSGTDYLPPCIMSHNPVDLVILMLGTNDAKQRFGGSSVLVARCNSLLIEQVRRFGESASGSAPEILLAAPIKIGAGILNGDMAVPFGEYAVNVAAGFGSAYADVAAENKCHFIDTSKYASPSEIDSVHLTAEGHAALAKAFAEKIKTIL